MPAYDTSYSKTWEKDDRFKEWIAESKRPDKANRAVCRWCNSDFSIKHGGVNDVIKHAKAKKHTDFETARKKVPSVQTLFCELFLHRLNRTLHI